MTPEAAPPPPPPPGLMAEYARQGAWLFRRRSYPPLLALALVLMDVVAEPVPMGGSRALLGWVAAGMALGLLGLLLRGWTAGTIPMGTSGRGTRVQRAETLNTEGAYSLVRHPLYLGNYLLWLGVASVAGDPAILVAVTLLFWLYYERIMMAEERYLWETHGAAFAAWAERTPAFLPRLSGWSPSPHPFSFPYALGRDYPAMYAFVVSTTAVALTRSVAGGEGWALPLPWLAWFTAGTTAYLGLHALKRLTRVLEVSDR